MIGPISSAPAQGRPEGSHVSAPPRMSKLSGECLYSKTVSRGRGRDHIFTLRDDLHACWVPPRFADPATHTHRPEAQNRYRPVAVSKLDA